MYHRSLLAASALLVAAVSFAGLGAQEAAKATEKELKALEGSWDVLSAMVEGKESDALKDAKLTFTFQKDKLTVKRNDNVLADTSIKLALDATPKLIDIKALSGDRKGTTFEGIYELKGSDLKLCINLAGTGRPTEFATKSGEPGVILITLKRLK